ALAVVGRLSNAGMVRHGGGARFSAEPLDERRVLGELLLEYFDRNTPAQPAVHRLPRLAQATGGDEPLEAVSTGQRHPDTGTHDLPPARSGPRAFRAATLTRLAVWRPAARGFATLAIATSPRLRGLMVPPAKRL